MFLEKFSLKRKAKTVDKYNVKLQRDFEVNLSGLEKYDKSELVDFVKKYEKYASFLKQAQTEQFQINEEAVKEKQALSDEMKTNQASIEFLRQEAETKMDLYQKQLDTTESNKYVENFAVKQLKNVAHQDDGHDMETMVEEIHNKFRITTSKFAAINTMIDEARVGKDSDDFVEKYEKIKGVMGTINEQLLSAEDFFNEDIPIINDNIAMVIERFDSLCDEINHVFQKKSFFFF